MASKLKQVFKYETAITPPWTTRLNIKTEHSSLTISETMASEGHEANFSPYAMTYRIIPGL